MGIIQEAVRKNKKIKLIAYSVSDVIEGRLKVVLRVYLKSYGCGVLFDPLYTILKELVVNAIKANYKNIYFEDYSPKNMAGDVIAYEKALELFRHEMERDEASYLTMLARRRDLKAEVLFHYNDDRLLISVKNPVSMTPVELENVSRKLCMAQQCTDIGEYLMNDVDEDLNREGAGLGLILIIMILRSLGPGTARFSLETRNGTTMANIEVPLTDETLEHFRQVTSSGRKPA